MDIQVYADKVTAEHESNQINVYLENIDLSLVLGQFSSKELLDHIAADDYSSIVDFVSNNDEA